MFNNDLIKYYTKKAISLRSKQYSDIIDDEGHQYVDLVQEGGGVLGIALVGYTYILEQAGIRFYNLAGTSAGAINTMFLASLGTIDEEKSEKVLNILMSKKLSDFIDGNSYVKKTLKHFILKTKLNKIKLAYYLINSSKYVINNLGLNPGIKFHTWLTSELNNMNIYNLHNLNEIRNNTPNLININDSNWQKINPKFVIISSDITTNTKVEFPKMAHLYWNDTNSINPADFVRASMSVPYFFTPFKIKNIPNNNKNKDKNWIKYASYYGTIPNEVNLVDGGLLSNFPINVFHINKIPSRPTFGVKLSVYRKTTNKTNNLLNYSASMISTMRQIYDYDFLIHHPDYNKLICYIDADKNFNWLNFYMTEKRKTELFLLGAKQAIEFLNNFNWNKYKKLRKIINEYG